MPSHTHTAVISNASITGDIDTTDTNTDARRCGTGDATGVFKSRENGSIFRYGKDGFVSAPTGISINATHGHDVIVNGAGENQPHDNMQPYIACYIWKRTA